MLQTSAFPSQEAARKEIERLKSHGVMARYLVKEDPRGNKWYAVYINLYPDREEAAQEGNRLIQAGIIRNFFIFPYQGTQKGAREAEALERSSRKDKHRAAPSLKKAKSLADIGPLSFGPVLIKEEESHILMTVGLSRRITPKVTTQKDEAYSRLFVTFPAENKVLVPVEFRRDGKPALQSFSVHQKGADITFMLVLNPSFNYEISQNYFDREKRYALKIRWEAAGARERPKEKGS
jgi:hypothetical protein